ncbi:MAG: hydroxypyruvate isomerase [Ruminococcaceae bacterium]|nr:hydroxypyruvate isomerase [Oscillospiraceae bacterium]
MKFSVCIDMMFADLPFMDRIRAAKAAGADAIEFWRWSNKDIDAIAALCGELGLSAALMNLESADEALSAALLRGILSHKRTDELVSAIHETAPVMRKLGMTDCIVLAGDVDEAIPYERAVDNIRETLRIGAKAAEEEGIRLLLEPLNTYDRATYVLPYSAPAFEIVRDVNSPALGILFDLYHTQRMEGNLIDTLTKNIDVIGHFHVAGSPWRCEPSLGEVDYKQVFAAIEAAGYDRYIGFEYRVKNPAFDLGAYIKTVKE